MPVQPVTHPSVDALRAFALGKLNVKAGAALMNHLDGCPDCCKQAAALSGDDFLARLRQGRGQSSSSTPAKALPETAGGPKPAPNRPAIPNIPPELAANQQYEILRELGRGGMGVVYLAKNKLMDRLEVLKVVNKALLDHPGAVERFLREIRSAAKLSHVNVVAAYSALQLGELLAFAMEYVEGQDLASVVKSQGPLPVLHACFYVQQAAHGLQHAHEKQMVHRDIKPQNLILAREGKKHIVKVLDFGLAKVMREKGEDTGLTGEGKMLGTPDYIAPEQTMDAARADIRADIYSLGCTLYYLLSGHPPFSASSLGAILLAHQMHEAKPLNLVRPEVPEELASVVRKMMTKTPAKRYQTPLAIVQALAPFVKQGARQKPSPELSSGEVEAKTAIKKAARVDPPPPPVVEAAKKQPEPMDVWGALTEDRIGSVAPHKNVVVLKRRTVTARERGSPNKWLMGSVIGAGMILMLLLGMWVVDVFKGKTPEETKQSQEDRPARLPDFITNSIDMKLKLVKPGTFLMGSPTNEEGRRDDEEQHEVEITRSFYVGVYEVTQQQYERTMGKNPSWFSSTGGGKDKVQGMDTRQFPVEMVSWEDAEAFCRQLSDRPEEKSNGRAYRLPTEAEWEYSCRGGHHFRKPSPPFHFGNSLSSSQANFDGSFPYGGAPKGPYLQRTAKVGFYHPPNHPLGLCDLHGNVWEWCADWYDAEYYQQSPRQDPQGPKNGERRRRVLRGGSWYKAVGKYCRSAFRHNIAPGDRGIDYGIRVVLVLAART